MKRKSLIDRGIRCALALGMVVLAAACGMDRAGHSPLAEENADGAGYSPLAEEKVGGAGYSPLAEENADGAGHSPLAGENAGSAGHSPLAEENADSASSPATEKNTFSAGWAAADNGGEGAAVSAEPPGERTARATLIQDELEIGIQGGLLTYGGLTAALPDGVEARLVGAQDNGNIFCAESFLSDAGKGRILDLCGAQEVYADRVWGDGIKAYLSLQPRVRLMHYTAAYDSEMALLCAFFDVLPGAVGRRMYADREKGEYAYRLEQDGYLYLFLVRGEEVCLVQEIAEEEKYSFDALLADGAVRWQDGGGVAYGKEPDAFAYRKLVPEEGISFLYVCERQKDSAKLRLYREGYFETPCQVIQGDLGSGSESWIQIKDVNSDGCPDLAGYGEIYLWDRQTKAYAEAQSGQGGVWSPNGQLYDGMAPGEVHGETRRTAGEQNDIPQGLLDEISNMMAAGKDPVILSEVGDGKESAVLCGAGENGGGCLGSAVVGRELTKEEVLILAGRDRVVRQQVQEAARFNNSYILLEADCDNDGRTDLVGQMYGHSIGGTSGNADYIFLKGQPDGSYVETDSFFEIQGTFGVIAYQGKNYVCHLDFDYDSMIYEGYTLRCYEEGKRVEEAALCMVPERYEIRQISAEPGYENLALRAAEACTAVKERLDEGQIITGEAEKEPGLTSGQTPDYALGDYRCDLDNDGQEDRYDKEIRYLANFYGKNYLEFTLRTNGVTGQNGAAGQKGTDGQSGAAGQKGTDGQSGAAGQKGTDGQSGAAGQKGTDGQSGAAGQKG
ncbi:MAG: hypothetical protein K2K90_03490, partial [Lachnospiraceae bacterium]|nr:hypothetical protein [Lachnospiraceae bacterium]